jgi:hypothetical protein
MSHREKRAAIGPSDVHPAWAHSGTSLDGLVRPV